MREAAEEAVAGAVPLLRRFRVLRFVRAAAVRRARVAAEGPVAVAELHQPRLLSLRSPLPNPWIVLHPASFPS